MKWLVRLTVLVSLALLSGCLSSAQDYVNENQQGYYMVRGKVHAVDTLNLTQWEDLKDGFVLVVDDPGCSVSFQQGDSKRTRFELTPGDRIVHSYEADFLLSALAPNQTPDKKKEAPKESPPAESDGAEDEAPSKEE